MSDYFRQNAEYSTLDPEVNWTILSPAEMLLKKHIEESGTILKEWDVRIYRGILTGYNEAFIINDKIRNELIAKSPKNAEIIRPILRGKDVKRYSIDYANLWLLFIPWHFPLNMDNTIKGASDIAEALFRETYPAVYSHLLKYKSELQLRNQTETGIRYEWYALQRYGANYWQEFNKPKIVWGNLALHSQFAFTSHDFIINAPSPFITTDNLYLLAILNSSVGEYYIRNLGVTRSGGYIEFKPMYVEQLPIPRISDVEQAVISLKVEEVLTSREQKIDTRELEREIDEMVYSLYNLSSKEIEYLKSFVTRK